MATLDRRFFLKATGTALTTSLIPGSPLFASEYTKKPQLPTDTPIIKLYDDGESFEPEEYINELAKIYTATKFEPDWYGVGGAVAALENKMATITGKEKAIFMPSGTMANQLAISILSGENTKIYVQDTSHVYRDEADAAQSVYNKRLMPLAPGEPFFTAQQLQNSIESLDHQEVFKSGIGAVSLENPVRRSDGKSVPIEEIRKISAYCRDRNIKLHLDGARVFIASAWTGVSVKDYASYFDTVYISLYKYFGATGGAVLCGNKDVIDKMPHLIKVHGGTMFGNWANAAMALNRIEGFEIRMRNAIQRSSEIFGALNKISGIQVSPLPGGTNIYSLDLSKEIDGQKMGDKLNKEFQIRMRRLNDKNHSMLTVNETLLYQSADYVVNAFKQSIQ